VEKKDRVRTAKNPSKLSVRRDTRRKGTCGRGRLLATVTSREKEDGEVSNKLAHVINRNESRETGGDTTFLRTRSLGMGKKRRAGELVVPLVGKKKKFPLCKRPTGRRYRGMEM